MRIAVLAVGFEPFASFRCGAGVQILLSGQTTKPKTRAEFKNALYRAASETSRALLSQHGLVCRIREMTPTCCRQWDATWCSVSQRMPPNGGWDWKSINERANCTYDEFAISMLDGSGGLAGLMLVCVARSALKVRVLEGNPNVNHPLKKWVIAIAVDFATRFAQEADRGLVHLMEPAEGLLRIYTGPLQFTYVRPKKGQSYCERRVL